MFWPGILGTNVTLKVPGGFNHFWSVPLLQHDCTHSLGTRVSQVLVDLGQDVLIFFGQAFDGFVNFNLTGKWML